MVLGIAAYGHILSGIVHDAMAQSIRDSWGNPVRRSFQSPNLAPVRFSWEVKRILENQTDFHEKKKGVVQPEKVHMLLTHPFYAGHINHRNFYLRLIKGHHEPLISLRT